MINGYSKNHLFIECFNLFKKMCLSGDALPDEFTFSTLAKACGDNADLWYGKLIHCVCMRNGFVSDSVVGNSIVLFYCKCGEFVDARKMFDEMPSKKVSSWNALIVGLVNSKEDNWKRCAWEVVKGMQIEGFKPDMFTLSSLFPLCQGHMENYGRQLHCYVIRNGFDLGQGSGLSLDVHLGCCLIDMYSRSKKIKDARLIFDGMKYRNVFVWTSMVNGYVQNILPQEALILFREMQVRDGIEPNKISLVSILPACSSLSSLMGGKQVHGFAIRRELNCEVSLCNAMIDMYCKCGSLKSARQVFDDDSFFKDAISWSSMICGYGLHGQGREAISLYEKMQGLGIKPDTITVVGVLSACSKSLLVNEGLNIYSSIVNDHNTKPTLEICACMVDMLGRSGQLKQALDFIKTMPMQPGPSVWGALLSSSILHGNFEMRDLAYKYLIQIEPENPSNYVSLSNLCASSQKWDVVAEVRTMMKEKQLRKSPGCSWITINSETHSFYVADKAHALSRIIYEMLDELALVMKGDQSSPDSEILA